MDKESSEIDWSQFPHPLPSTLFDKYTHQSLVPPLSSLGIDESTWHDDRLFALNLAKRGFTDPLAILYTSFKRSYPNCLSIRSFARWLALHEHDHTDFKNYFKQYSVRSTTIQSIRELIRLAQTLEITETIVPPSVHIEQIWFLFSISIRLPTHGYQLIADTIILDEAVTGLSGKSRKAHSPRIHCLFALTPSGKFSNQLILCKQSRGLKLNLNSSAFTRIVSTVSGDINCEHLHQWLEDFISLSYGNKNSAILIDPRTSLLTRDFQRLCQTSQIDMLTIDLNYYLIHILSPIMSIWNQQWADINRLDRMFLRSPHDLRRIVYSIWCSLRTLKQNEQISALFHQTFLWRNQDQLYRQASRSIIPKKKKKKSLAKIASKGKLSASTMMTDPPSESTPEEILSFVIERQLSTSRAGKFLGGMKLDYLKYCLSYKSKSSLMTGSHLVQLNTFMQSQLTVDWLRRLRSSYFWPCAKPLFLREIYRLIGIIARKRSMHFCGNGNIGSIRSCDLQSPGIFWKAFEDIHQIQLDNESVIDHEQWHDDFQQYLIQNKLDHDETQLWTMDTFEFPLIKKSTVLQLPEWNELRPMNLTPKVTVLYAFSNTGQSIEPKFIFPTSLRDSTITDMDEQDFCNELGHLTPQIFLSWVEKYLISKASNRSILIFCSRLPILSQTALNVLEQSEIYPYGYPYTRTLPFRYLFERRVRNNRSTNLMSELWKKKLLDEQRTHILKGSTCTMKTIKYYFEQIWSQFLHEKREDDDDGGEQKTWEDQCQQAFQQANIQVKINREKTSPSKNPDIVLNGSSTPTAELTTNNEEIVGQLNHLLTTISQVKQQISSANSSPILKMNNHIQQNTDELIQLCASLIQTISNVDPPSTSFESISPSHTSSVLISNGDKRSIDEYNGAHPSKRLRSSTTTMNKWIPPSNQLVTRLQTQSPSLFQFISSLIDTIFTSEDHQLTDEHSRWLHSTVNLHGHRYNMEKINVLIETACTLAKLKSVR